MITPQIRPSFSFGFERARTVREQNKRTAMSIKLALSTWSGRIQVENPRMNKILKMFEPTTFPMAMSFSPLQAATMEIISSGRLVPKAMIVRPIRRSLIPKARAMYSALLIVNCPPAIIPASPRTVKRMLFQTGFVSSVSVSSAGFSKADLKTEYM